MPRVTEGSSFGYGYAGRSLTFYYEFEITNRGLIPVEVVGVGRPGPGLEPVPYPPEFAGEPYEAVNEFGSLAPGEEMRVAVAYEVTDCDAVPDESWPVPVEIARPWGVYTVWIELPLQSHSDFNLPPDRTHATGAVSWQHDVEWQRSLADAACYYHAGGEPWDWPEGGD